MLDLFLPSLSKVRWNYKRTVGLTDALPVHVVLPV